jgi:hypothetical protein
MRAHIGLVLVTMTAVAGCGSAPSHNSGRNSAPPADRANGRAACLAVQKATDTYGTDILSVSDEERTGKTQAWSGAISKAARGVDDTRLRATLLSLADVVRGWAVRPPDRTAVRGFQNDLGVACHPYLSNPT